MPFFKTISEKKAKGKVKTIYDEIKKVRKIKKIPNFWKTLANDPSTPERTWNSLQQVMKKGVLARSFNKRNDLCSCIND